MPCEVVRVCLLAVLAVGVRAAESIVYTRTAPGRPSQIVLRSPSGAERILTSGFHAAADPDVSFDAARILFAAQRRPGDRWSIWEMNAGGAGARQITQAAEDCRSPIYQSPIFYLNDPAPVQQIGYVSGGNLYSVRMDGSGVRRLTYNLARNSDPAMLPDGRIVFASGELYGINIDGTDYAAFSGNQGQRRKRMPAVTSKGLVAFVEGAGALARISLRRNLHSYRLLAAGGVFDSPSPLPDGALLVSRRTTGTFGVYRFDPETKSLRLLFDDPAADETQAKALAARERPDGRSSVVEDKEPTGKLYCLSVYESDEPSAPGTVKRLRVIEGLEGGGNRLLGEVEVEEDGSFQLEVPANTPIRLQTLDKNGVALRTSAWIWAKNKENRGCIGCHEDGERTPENVMAKALTHPAIKLTLAPERRRTVEFTRDAQPILRAKCLNRSCHALPALLKTATPWRARSSPLAARILAGSMPPKASPQLTGQEKRTIIEWIDLGALRKP